MLSGKGRAPDFDRPDAGLGCDGAVNNKDSPSLSPSLPFPLSPSLQIYKGPDGGGLRPKVEGRQRWVGGRLCSGRSPEKILEYRARRVGEMGKMGIWEGMGKEEEEKVVERRRFFGRKIFYTTEKCTLWVRQSIAIDNVIWGARRRLVEGFYEVSDMELLIGVGWK